MAVSVIGQNPLFGYNATTNGLSGDILGQRTYGNPLDALNSGASIFGGFDPTTSQLAAQFGGMGCGGYGGFNPMMNMMGMGSMGMGGMMNPMMGSMGMFGMMDQNVMSMSPKQRQRYFSDMMIDQERCNNQYELERAKLNVGKGRDLKGLNFLAQSRPQTVDRCLKVLDREITNNEQEKVMAAYHKALSALRDEFKDMGLDVNNLAETQNLTRDEYLKSELLKRYETQYGDIENRLEQYGDGAFLYGFKRTLTGGLSNNRMVAENVRDIVDPNGKIDKGEKPKAIVGKIAGGLAAGLAVGGLVSLLCPPVGIALGIAAAVGTTGYSFMKK